MEPCHMHAHPKHPSESRPLSAFAEEHSATHCWLLEREAPLIFISLWGIPKGKGFYDSCQNSVSPFHKKNKHMMCGSIKLSKNAMWAHKLLGDGDVWAHSCLWTLGQNESRLFPAPVSFVTKKKAVQALLGGLGLLPA
jgi:hypothetical protein